jgi:hypothetical protein
VRDQKPKDIAKLPKDLFKDPVQLPKMLPHISTAVLDVIGSAGGDTLILDQTERSALKQYIMSQPGINMAVTTYLNSKGGKMKFGN